MKNNLIKIFAVALVITGIMAYKYSRDTPSLNSLGTSDRATSPHTSHSTPTSSTTSSIPSTHSTASTSPDSTDITTNDTLSNASTEELFNKLISNGIKFMDFFDMKEINNIDDLTKYLKESTGLPDNPNVVNQEINNSLKSTLKFIEKYRINYDETLKTTYQDTTFHNTSLPIFMRASFYPEDTINMVALEKELTSQRGTKYISKFKKTLIKDLNRFGPIEYVSGDAQRKIGDDINTRRNHINQYFQLPQKKKTDFHTQGEVIRWATIRYKLAFIADVYPTLRDKEKKFVLKYILHGGKRCDDAKLEATEALHSAYCKENKTLLNSMSNSIFLKTGKNLKSISFEELISLLFYEYRKETLHNFLEYLFFKSNVYEAQYSSKIKKDHATYYPATWNHLAEGFGVKPKLSRYPGYIAKFSQDHFINYTKTNYTPQGFLKFIKNKHKKEYKVLLDRLNLELGYLESFFNNPKQKDNIIDNEFLITQLTQRGCFRARDIS